MKKTLLTLFALMLVLGISAGNKTTARKKIAHPVVAGTLLTAKKAAKADANKTVDLYFTEYGNMSFSYYDDPGDWYFGCNDDSGDYIVRLDYLTTEDGKYGTYTLSDLITDYSYIADFTGDEEVDYAYLDGTTFTVSQEGYTMYLTGQLVCDNGVTYVLHGEIPLPEPQTYDIEATELNRIQYYEEDQDWLVAFSSDNFKIRLDLNSSTGAFAGTYTQDDIYGETYVEDLYEYETDYLDSLNVTMSIPEGYDDPNVACEVTGTGVGQSGNTYNFHFKLDPPVKPKEVVDVDVNVDSASWPDDFGGATYVLTEKNNTNEKWNLQYWNLTGEYSEDGLNLQESKRYNSETGEEQTVLHGTVSQTFDSETMKVTAKAELVMSDSIQYNLNFVTPTIETKGEVSYTFTNLDFDDSYAEQGYQQITASNDQASIDVSINNAEVPGTYNDKTVTINISEKSEDGDIYVSPITVLNASTTYDEAGKVVFNARMIGKDDEGLKFYNIDACFIMPEITDTLTITMNNVNITDYTEDGWESGFYLSGSTDDYMTSLWMGIGSTQIPGHYTIDDITSFSHGSGITFVDENYNETKALFYAGECDVTKEGRLVTLKGDFQAGSHFVHLTLVGKTDVPGAIEDDNEDEGINISFTADELYSINLTDDGLVVRLQNENRNDVLWATFILNDYDGTNIPEGEYPVNQYGEAPCISAGSTWDTSLFGTFYGLFDSDGYVQFPLWFLAYGKATVTNNNGKMAFEIDGQNSYYQPFHVTYNMSNDGINNHSINSDNVKKYMKNSNLIIRKDGKEYNAVGQQMK